MVLAKAVMLGVLMVLGGINFLMLRNLPRDQVMPRLRRLIEAEVGIGITVILTAASLTSQPPAVDQPNDIVSFHRIVHASGPSFRGSPTLTRKLPVPPVLHQRQLPLRAASGCVRRGRRADSLRAWSLTRWNRSRTIIGWGCSSSAMGMLALLARTGKAPWAEYWPLLLIGIAIFIILQADSECWPVGWKSVGACMVDPEVFQHRLAALVCIGFAIFELRVRKRQRDKILWHWSSR